MKKNKEHRKEQARKRYREKKRARSYMILCLFNMLLYE